MGHGLEQRDLIRGLPLPRLSGVDQNKFLRDARRDIDWLGKGPSVVHQVAVGDPHQAYVNWWKNPGAPESTNTQNQRPMDRRFLHPRRQCPQRGWTGGRSSCPETRLRQVSAPYVGWGLRLIFSSVAMGIVIATFGTLAGMYAENTPPSQTLT